MKGFGVIKPMVEVGWIEKPDPKADQFGAVLKPLVVAPCSSDVHNAFELGDNPSAYNRILGHETVARVVEVGSSVTDFRPGDVVVIPAVTPNWRQPNLQDEPHQHSGGLMGGLCLSSTIDGTMAEYVYIPDADMNLAAIPEGVSWESAVMVTDMMTTGFHGVELANVQYGDDVCVMGIGPVGLMAVAGAALRGAANIYAVGSRPTCVEKAKDFGATKVISYKEGSVSEQIMNLTHGRGVDAAIVAGGGAESIESGFLMTRAGGNISNVDVISDPKGVNLSLWALGFGMSHRHFVGGMCPGGRRRMERMLGMVAAGRIDPGKMITHRFEGFDSFPEAFDLMVKKPADLVKPIVYTEKH